MSTARELRNTGVHEMGDMMTCTRTYDKDIHVSRSNSQENMGENGHDGEANIVTRDGKDVKKNGKNTSEDGMSIKQKTIPLSQLPVNIPAHLIIKCRKKMRSKRHLHGTARRWLT